MKAVLLILFVLASSFLAAQNHPLTIRVSGLNNNTGQVILDVFKSENGFPMETNHAILRKKLPIVNKAAVFTVNLPQGVYAFALIHDENLNNLLDQNFIGIPKEGAAASNNAEGFMGPPSYEKAKFPFFKATTTNIKMLYF